METLYTQITPEKLAELMDQFYDRVFSSPIISPLFKTDKEEIKQKQLMFLSQFLGGPALYTAAYGHPKMRMRHLPHVIDNEAKEEWLRCMKEAINAIDISEELKVALYNCFPPIAQHMVNS
jgi:hemoglobin